MHKSTIFQGVLWEGCSDLEIFLNSHIVHFSLEALLFPYLLLFPKANLDLQALKHFPVTKM